MASGFPLELIILIAASTLSTDMTGKIGPNISSCNIFEVNFGLSIIAGGTYLSVEST